MITIAHITKRYQIIVFVFYLLLLFWGVENHEPWMDEAQAWLLAQDVSLKELLVKYLRYEGSPGLWHLVLMLLVKCKFPYSCINIISALFSAAGTWLFIRYSPFPWFIKILYPFSFFVFFQYGIVARSYCLISGILFLIAIIFPRKGKHPYLFFMLLCLLANVSVHTFIIAGSIALLHSIEVLECWKSNDRRYNLNNVAAMAIFGIVACLVLLMTATPADHVYARVANWNVLNFIEVSKAMVGGSLVINEFSKVKWLSGAVSLLIFYISLLWLSRTRKAALYLLPTLLICCVFAIKYRSLWHQGVLFQLWIFVLWVSFSKYSHVSLSLLAKNVFGCVALVLGVQAYWGFDAWQYDIGHNYSASKHLAGYIKKNKLDELKIYASGWRNISVLPYFSHKIFFNLNYGSPHRFWDWSTHNKTSVGASDVVINKIVRLNPDMVIFSSDHIASGKVIYLPGYKPVAFFEGYLCWKTGVIEPECYLVFRKR